jgi:hypothetical protein
MLTEDIASQESVICFRTASTLETSFHCVPGTSVDHKELCSLGAGQVPRCTISPFGNKCPSLGVSTKCTGGYGE